MRTEPWWVIPLAVALPVAALVLIWLAWRGDYRWPVRSVASGGVLLLASLSVWRQIAGIEFGTLYWLGTIAISAWLIIMGNVETGNGKTATKVFCCTAWSGARFLSGFGMFLLAGPLNLFLSTVIALLLVRALPLQPANSWIIAAFALPLIWAAETLWAFCSSRPRQWIAGWNLGLSAVCLLVLYSTHRL